MSAFPSVIDLATFDPEYGFVISLPAAASISSLSDAGDLNGDGFDDIIIGDTGEDRAYVIFGRAGGYPALDAAAMAPGEGLVITDNSTGDNTGRSVSSLGDINGDGLADIIVGAPQGDDGGNSAGEAYVIYGSSTLPSAIDLTALTLSQGFVIRGDAEGDSAGRSVSSAGDVNGDGLDDILIGAPYGDNGGNGAGEAYLLFGRSTGFGNIDLTFAFFTTDNGIVIRGAESFDQAGSLVSSAGDVNGDGFDDMLVTAPYNSDAGYYAGRIYVIFGKADGWAPIDLGALSAGDGFAIHGDAYDYLSRASEAGDINGDGFDDLLVPGGSFSDELYVVYGKASGFGTIDLTAFSSSQGFIIRGGDDFSTGSGVSSAGDVNGDGHDDIIINAFGGNGNAFVIFGKDGGFGTIDLTTLAPEAGFRIAATPDRRIGSLLSAAGDLNGDGFDDLIASAGSYAEAAYIIYGRGGEAGDFPLIYEVSAISPAFGGVIKGDLASDSAGNGIAAGDVNGDGFDDLIIGAPGADANGQDSGSAWLVFGSAAGFGNLDLSLLGTDLGIRIDGAEGDRTGFDVATADTNGDGLADIVIGSRDAGSFEGAVHVVFGKEAGWADMSLATLAPAEGFRIGGDAAGDQFGTDVANAGDVNGDGYDDIIVGAPLGEAGGTNTGEAYVIFGKAGGFASIDVTSLPAADGFRILGDADGDDAGRSVSSAGDINNDGYDDLIVGAGNGDNAATNAGEAYVIFGHAGAFSNIDLTTLTPAVGFTLRGDDANDQAGRSVSSAGDVNGDGFGDIVIGAPYGDNGGSNAGETYVVFGKGGGFANVDLGNLTPADGFVIQGRPVDQSGFPVSNAGDVNGDGFDDLLIGARFGDTGGPNDGDAFVIFGKAPGFGTIDLAALTVDQGFIIANEGAGGIGVRVAAGGDLNGDGLDDIIMSRPTAGGDSSGLTFVIYGRLPGNDVVRAGSAIGQTINGGRGEDMLSGLGGADRLIGHGGADVLEGGSGNDRLFGGAGRDAASYATAAAAVTVRLTATAGQNTGAAGTDVLNSIEDVIGSGFADSLYGTAGINRLEGGAGDDVLSGYAGKDALLGGAGDDVLRGGGGVDTMTSGLGDDIIYVQQAGDAAIELADQGYDQVKAFVHHVMADNVEEMRMLGGARGGTGNSLDNAIFGSAGDDTILGLDGNDILRGGGGEDALDGGGGADRLFGSVAIDGLLGGDGDDELRGEGSSDFLNGGLGNDDLRGGEGGDTMQGGDGDDHLIGGLQKDTLRGGAGADTFLFDDGDTGATRFAADIVADFRQSERDRIHLRQIDADAAADGDQNFTFIGTNAFTGSAGQLRYSVVAGHAFVEGDTNGDGGADFLIRIENVTSLQAGDFML
ncbi:beta strand repeat-containing protein [Enterovirga sp. GCM10030262]|uniref:beta strand repeat-containing protein n=1 Tax=Enterovirga sp. GCM10030262 TaxID=3273391 RepID=UPI0036231921